MGLQSVLKLGAKPQIFSLQASPYKGSKLWVNLYKFFFSIYMLLIPTKHQCCTFLSCFVSCFVCSSCQIWEFWFENPDASALILCPNLLFWTTGVLAFTMHVDARSCAWSCATDPCIYIYRYIYIHICIYIYMYIYMCIYAYDRPILVLPTATLVIFRRMKILVGRWVCTNMPLNRLTNELCNYYGTSPNQSYQSLTGLDTVSSDIWSTFFILRYCHG